MSKLLSYFLSNLWALEETTLNSLTSVILDHDRGARYSPEEIAARIQAKRGESVVRQASEYRVVDGVAIVSIYGVISKYSAGVAEISEPAGTSTTAIRNDLDAALSDPNVKAILLDIESPGGAVDGVADLADAIHAANERVPVVAFANDLMASGAYWLGAQASEIVASQLARVGSIGVYQVLVDTSRAAENAGMHVDVVKAGAFKGAGLRGTPITDAVRSEAQRIVSGLCDHFVSAVARGRKLSVEDASALADGRIHIGSDARALKLVDRIDSFDATLARLTKSTRTISAARGGMLPKGDSAMADTPINLEEERTKARIEAQQSESQRVSEIKGAFPNDPAFALEQISQGRGLLEAKAAYADHLAAQLKTRDEELVKARADANKKQARKDEDAKPASGVQGLATVQGEALAGSSVREQFDGRVQAEMERGLSRAKAVSTVVAKHPELHQALIDEANVAR